MLAISTVVLSAQTRPLIGKVVDENDEGLIGATVKVEGTTQATATDVEGQYTVAVKTGSKVTLTISYIGYKTVAVEVGPDQNNIVTKMEVNSNVMDEVVVIGYGTAKKQSLTSSVETISGDELIRIPAMNVDQTLAGQVAGLGVMSTTGDPSSAKEATMSIRGNTGNPLLVIDGVPRLGTNTSDGEMRLSDLNPDDIQSISILKDAAAAAVYGARAANGVIVITTKKAAEGKPEVSFSSTFTARKYSRYNDNLTNSADVIAIERAWAAQYPELLAGGESAAKVGDDLRLNSHPSLGVSTLIDMYSGAISMSEGNARLDALSALGYRYYDQAKEYGKRNPFHQQYNLRVAQSSERNSFSASATFWKHNNEDINDGDHSLGINITDQMKVTDWLTADFGAYIKYGRENIQNYNLLNPGFTFLPYDGLVAADGSYIAAPAQGDASRRESIAQYGMVPEVLVPMDELNYGRSKAKSLETRVFGKLRFNFTSWLNYDVQFQYETANTDTDYLQDRYSYNIVTRLNSFVTRNAANGALTYNLPEGDVMYRTALKSRGYDFRQQLNFNYRLNDLHNILVFVGQEVRDNRMTFTDNTYFGYDPELLSWQPFNQQSLSYFSGVLGAAQLNMSNLESMHEISNRFVSFYGNASYSLADKYNLTASLRWDRSNLWGTSSKYQNKPIWSIGASWNLNRESFIGEQWWLNNLQLRASYGIGGNIGRNTAPYMTAQYFPGSFGTTGMVIAPPNKDIRWEKTRTINVGVDFDLLRNRLWGSIDYYHKKSTDLLALISGSPTQGFGFSTLTTNNGAMNNQGLSSASRARSYARPTSCGPRPCSMPSTTTRSRASPSSPPTMTRVLLSPPPIRPSTTPTTLSMPTAGPASAPRANLRYMMPRAT